MGLVDYETDVEDETSDKLWKPSTEKGGKISQRHKGSVLGKPPATRDLFSSAESSGGRTDPLFDGDEHAWKRTPGEVNTVEMEVGGIMRKVMSVELAIKKENAYKSKFEGLQRQNHDDLQEPLGTVQGVGTNIRKRQASPTDPSCSPPRHAMKPYNEQVPPQYTRQSSHLSCLPPQHAKKPYNQESPPQFTRQSNLSYSPGQHARQLNISCSPPQLARQSYSQQAPLQPPESVQMVIQTCKLCNVVCSGALNLQSHYQGKKHRTKLEDLRLQKDGVIMGTAPVNCELCQVICMSEEHLQQHRAGKKHIACLQAIGTWSQKNSSS